MHNNAWYFRKGYRKMVKSPEPVDILEKDTIETMSLNGYVPMVVGGGGIPVTDNQNGYNGFDGVIDKDLSSSLLATSIGASEFIIITDGDNVYLDYKNKKGKINRIKYDEMLDYYNKINFEEGTIKPKILASLRFIENGGTRVYIISIKNIGSIDTGTVIEK